MKKILFMAIFTIAVLAGTAVLLWQNGRVTAPPQPGSGVSSIIHKTPPTPLHVFSDEPIKIPESYTLTGGYQTFQTFNNCGPASLSMALSYYGLNFSQQEIGQQLRPWQNASGDNDDKSVTLQELASYAQSQGLIAYHRPAGNLDTLRKFIANDMPVITRTWTSAEEDIGHYRVVKGYTQEGIIQDDSLQGKDLFYTDSQFNTLWKKFNYEYLVLVPDNKQGIAQNILKDDLDTKTAWQKAIALSQQELAQNPEDIYARFNLSVAYYNIGNYKGSVEEYEKVENSLPFRTLWYQIEPIRAYYELGNHQRVFEITDEVLNNHNRAFSELYVIRGNIYKDAGQTEKAREQFELAVRYNKNMYLAQEALNSL